MAKMAPYGTWKSPITPDLVAGNAKRFSQLALDRGSVFWTELRPDEGGRVALMRLDESGSQHEVSDPGMNVRTRVHEYGGGEFVVGQGTVAYANFGDQLLYRADGGKSRPLTTHGMRYADAVVDSRRNRIICVREDHTGSGEPENTIVELDLGERGVGQVLCSGHDFYSTPRLSPDGSRLCWLAWNHPEMPWTRTQLWTAHVGLDGSLSGRVCVIDGDESVFQPAWSPDGTLYFVSDRSGWWNLYRWQAGEIQPVLPMEAEFGRPQWVFGVPTFGFRDAETIVCSYTRDGMWTLAQVDLHSGTAQAIDLPYTSVADVHVDGDRVVFVGGSPTIPAELVLVDLATGHHTVLRRSSKIDVSDTCLSRPRSLDYRTRDGADAHALFYPPRNDDFAAPPGERPPLIVVSHGGPTGSASSALQLGVQFWTSRGFAVLDVNYGGSTGYGRAYRQRLDGKWGIVDVDDCIACAQFLADKGEVDGGRMMIRGGSAGGYTTLAALTFRDVFRAGASYYGVSDLAALAEETHKFESRYLDGLVGPYPERRDIYQERSPVFNVDELSCPIIFFQGLEDKVVPPNQAEMMVGALREKGIPVAYVAFEGEQHGFRRAENIARSLSAELYFYGQILGLRPHDEIDPVLIENLPGDERVA